MALPLDRAYLTAIWLETLFYGACVRAGCLKRDPHLYDLGINFTLCWICGYVLIKKKGKTPWIMLAVVIFQWMLSTVHVSLGFTVRICPFHRRSIMNTHFSPDTAIGVWIHLQPRQTWRSRCLLLGHFNTLKRGEGLHPYPQCKFSRFHWTPTEAHFRALIFDFVVRADRCR